MLRQILCVLIALSAAPAHHGPGVGSAAARNGYERAMARVRADEVVSGQWTVGVRPGASSAEARRVVRAAGARVRQVSADGRSIRVETSLDTSAQAVAALADDPAVAFVEPVLEVRAQTIPSDPAYVNQWGLAKIGAPNAWNVSTGARSVVIAVVDSGVSLTHPDLAGHIDTANDYDFVNLDTTAADDEGHGTVVAGIAAAMINGAYGAGVAPTCTILPVKVLDQNGSGTSFNLSLGIRWAADHGADVINLSLGQVSPSFDEQQAIAYALQSGCVVVAAAGNDGTYGTLYPAGFDGVIGVGATDAADNVASFSNYGPGVDLVAPGFFIVSTSFLGGMVAESGTSMSTPFVSGAAALVLAMRPTFSATQVAGCLESTALDKGAAGRDDRYGHGRLDLAGAMRSLAPENIDDDVPGVPLATPVTTGTLAAGDLRDAYSVAIPNGGRLQASLAASAGCDFSASLYAPGTLGLAAASPVATSTASGAGQNLSFADAPGGTYYLAVERTAGSGAYVLDWQVTPNTPPTATPVAFACAEDTSATGDLLPVKTDADGQTLSAGIVSGPAHGSVQLAASGPMRYTPQANYYGADTFTFKTYDGFEYSAPASVTITVTPVNDSPVLLGGGDVVVAEDSGNYSKVWARAISPGPPNESGQQISVVTTCSNGAIFSAAPRVDTGGRLTFAPAANANGSCVVTVTVTDDGSPGGVALSRSVTFTVIIAPAADPTSIVLTSASRITAYGEAYYLTGALRSTVVPVAGRRVVLQRASSAAGPWFATSRSATTAADGRFTMPAAAPSYKAYYRAAFAGQPGEALSCVSAYVCVTPRASVGSPRTASTLARDTGSAAWGYLKPRHAAGSFPVRVYSYRYQSGAWRLHGYVNARAYDYAGFTRYSATVRFPYAGKWRLRAYAPADSGHAAAWSPSSSCAYVTVR